MDNLVVLEGGKEKIEEWSDAGAEEKELYARIVTHLRNWLKKHDEDFAAESEEEKQTSEAVAWKGARETISQLIDTLEFASTHGPKSIASLIMTTTTVICTAPSLTVKATKLLTAMLVEENLESLLKRRM